MRGAWWNRTSDARSPWAQAVAIACTAAIVVAVSIPLAPRGRPAASTTARRVSAPEHLTYLSPTQPVPRPPPQPSPPRTREANRPRPAPPRPAPAGPPAIRFVPPPPDSSATSRAPAGASRTRPPAVPLTVDRSGAAARLPGGARLRLLIAPSGISARPSLSAIGMDSARRALAGDVPRLALTRKPSQEQIDAELRERERQQANTWEAHRPVALPLTGGGVSVPFPLFAAGPSRAQRRRDSIVNADYVARLARMMKFARARLDSLCRVDSVARASAQCRELRMHPDSMPVAPDSGGRRR